MMWMCDIPKPTRTTTRIFDIIAEYQRRKGQAPPLDIKDSDNNTIAETADIFPLWIKYGDFLYSQSKLVVSIVENEPLEGGYIFADWENFCARNADNLKRMIDALFSDYNPIENYSMTESGADGDKEDKTEIAPSGTTSTAHFQTGINSSGDGELTDKSTISYENAKSTTTPSNTQSMSFDGSTYSGFYKAREHYFKRAGNIGVTTSAQMIGQEIELRKYCDLLADFVHNFIMQYCYFAG